MKFYKKKKHNLKKQIIKRFYYCNFNFLRFKFASNHLKNIFKYSKVSILVLKSLLYNYRSYNINLLYYDTTYLVSLLISRIIVFYISNTLNFLAFFLIRILNYYITIITTQKVGIKKVSNNKTSSS